MRERLTPQNQIRAIYDDSARVRAGRGTDYGIMEHILLLAKRVAALEAAARRDSDGSGEAGETGTGSTEGDSAGRNGIAQPPTPSSPTPTTETDNGK